MEKFIPRKPEKEVISMRIATEVLEQIDAEADACDISRNEFINQCIAFALRHMETTKAE
ncbi:MAG: CopG family transcriptional regulator [Oscillospiraceae bacterium]|nr:CopG family transcriptional regulator [Oscillospiraceae bacterium]